MADASVLLSLTGIAKRFPGVLALDGVDLDVRAGEVHALMGENGAGKSTLIKVATGVYPIDAGEIRLDGTLVKPRSPADAVRLGISTVYQEVNLVPNLSVAENICLAREPRGLLGIRWQELRRRATLAIQRMGIELDVRRPLGSYSIAIQQLVAIARALDVSAKVLILDEPTSSLDSNEVAQLFDVVRRLRGDGIGIIFVTHFLDQVYQISDRITILRNGKRVGTWNTAELSRIDLVTAMIGRDASSLERPKAVAKAASTSPPVIDCTGLGRRGAVSDVSFTLRAGEVLGFAGLLGSGRTEALRLIFGLDSADVGELNVDGKKTHGFSPRAAIRGGIGFCSEDRRRDGLFPDMSLRENVLLAMQARRGWLRRMPMSLQREISERLVGRLRIQPADIENPIQFLSGGNQQKALLARWLAIGPRVLLLDEPTRGIDVGAKFEVMSLVEELRTDGTAFIFVSSELAEVVHSCTSVMVMRDRRAVTNLEPGEINEERIIRTIAGDEP